MKKLERLLVETLLFNKEPPQTKPRKVNRDLTAKQLVKVLKALPEIKKELEDALKALEPPKKKDEGKLTIIQKYILITVAAFTAPPLYYAFIKAVFL